MSPYQTHTPPLNLCLLSLCDSGLLTQHSNHHCWNWSFQPVTVACDIYALSPSLEHRVAYVPCSRKAERQREMSSPDSTLHSSGSKMRRNPETSPKEHLPVQGPPQRGGNIFLKEAMAVKTAKLCKWVKPGPQRQHLREGFLSSVSICSMILCSSTFTIYMS